MKKGFTLVEMVVVMSIVGIIFLLTVPNIARTLVLVNEKGCEAQIKIVDAAIIQYTLEKDRSPNTIGDLVSEGFLSQKQTQCSSGKQIEVSNGKAH